MVTVAALCALGLFVLWLLYRDEQRRRARLLRLQALEWFGRFARDRDSTAARGYAVFMTTHNPAFDPSNYDSTWEYANEIRRHVDLPALVTLVPSGATAVVNGVRHHTVWLEFGVLHASVLRCDADCVAGRVDADINTATCLFCVAKEHDDGP